MATSPTPGVHLVIPAEELSAAIQVALGTLVELAGDRKVSPRERRRATVALLHFSARPAPQAPPSPLTGFGVKGAGKGEGSVPPFPPSLQGPVPPPRSEATAPPPMSAALVQLPPHIALNDPAPTPPGRVRAPTSHTSWD